MIKANRHTAILSFKKEDIEAAFKTDSGLEIVTGGMVSDRDLYFTPQKCTIVDIKHDFFKNGDVVYVEYLVWNAGTGLDQRSNSRVIEDNGDEKILYCYHNQIFCKIENGKIISSKDWVICEKKDKPVKSKFLYVISSSEKVTWCIVKASNHESEFEKENIIAVPTKALYDHSKIEGKWYYIVPADKIFGKLETE